MKCLPLSVLATALALASASPAAAAGSPNFAVSLYQCSQVVVGGQNVGDNCISAVSEEETYEQKLDSVESTVDDPESGGD